jgi:superfamily I DNA/RNA helicase
MLLKDYSRIHVHHFDGWAISNGITRRKKDPATGKIETDESLGKRLLENLKERTGDYRHYDAILIDEAQDFPPIWFTCILEALRDPLDGDLLIVCDGNQGVRLIGSVSWKSLGIKAAGRSIHQAFDLDRNYRNTREILKLAQHFTAKNIKNSEDSISIVPVDPGQAIRRGPRPILYACKGHADECQRIIQIVKRLLDGKVRFQNKTVKIHPHEIGILYHGIPKKERGMFEGFIEDLNKVAPVTWLNENRWTRTKVFEQSIKAQTVYSAKGLQYRVVFVMWADQFKPRKAEDRVQEERLLYVALTRASDILIVTYSESNEFIEMMVKCGEAEGK